MATRTSLVRRAARAMNADAAVPKTAMPTYVAGSHFAPYASRKIAFAGMTTSASMTPKASACAASRAITPRSGCCSRRLVGEIRRRAQTRYELRDHAVGELGPVDEQLVEHGLVDAQDMRRLQRGD